jgi:hypothetical protein
MAYIRDDRRVCFVGGCHRPATHTVFNNVNGAMGTYCLRHATKNAAALTKSEQAVARQREKDEKLRAKRQAGGC